MIIASTAPNVCSNTYPDATIIEHLHHNIQTPHASSDGVSIFMLASTSCDWDYGDPVEVNAEIRQIIPGADALDREINPKECQGYQSPNNPIPGIISTHAKLWKSPLTRLTNVKRLTITTNHCCHELTSG